MINYFGKPHSQGTKRGIKPTLKVCNFYRCLASPKKGVSEMYAIIATGGKQHKVAVGDTIYVEKLEVADGKKVKFDTLMYSDGKKVKVGAPLVKGVTVEGKVLKQVKGKKVIVFKYKPKKNIRKKQGHRQKYTAVEITSIKAAADK